MNLLPVTSKTVLSNWQKSRQREVFYRTWFDDVLSFLENYVTDEVLACLGL